MKLNSTPNKIVLLLLFLFGNSAHAEFESGDTVGNGGDVIVCSGSGFQTGEVLDHFEATRLHHRTITLGSDDTSVEKKMEMLIQRVEELDPLRGKKYREEYKTFFLEASFLPDVALVDIPDSKNIALPAGNCELKQAVIQADPRFPDDKRYQFDGDIWTLLDSTNQALLIFHEIVYRDVLHQKRLVHKNSIEVRYFVGRIAAGDLYFRTEEEKRVFFQDTLGFEPIANQK